jgi:two-component system NtrC family sensor kinase
VRVVEQFEANTPEVLVDRHKVLQILVNLLRNAKYALDAQALAEKRLEIAIASNGVGKVAITVRDNGIGIAPENLTKIFRHGFTTKKEGHGFGLHSGALAAKQLGGSLTCQSDGLGHGAAFTLELPMAAPAEAIKPTFEPTAAIHN